MQTFQTLSIVIVKGETKIKKWSSREALKGGERFGERKQDNQETKIALCFVLGVPSIVGVRVSISDSGWPPSLGQ